MVAACLRGRCRLIRDAGLAQARTVGTGEGARADVIVAVDSPRLLNATFETISGTAGADYTCSFVPPTLTLLPGQPAIEADQISVDFSNCTSVWQVGTPTSIAQPSGPDYSSSTETASGSSPAISGSDNGYEKAWTTDVAGLTVTSDQSNISWAWNGNCVTSSSGSAVWWWRSGTGWSAPYDNGVWISPTCTYSDVWSQATFANPVFCQVPPLTVISVTDHEIEQ